MGREMNALEFSEIENSYTTDPRLEAVKGVLGMLTDEGGRIFSPMNLDTISKRILFWIDQVGHDSGGKK
jgi:hypothetical protein